MPNIKLISIGLIVLFWLAFARTPVVLVTALTSTLSPALVNAQESQGEVKTTKISCRAPVHQTGQTDCYNDNNQKVPCPGSHEGQDGNQKKGAKWAPQSRFTDNEDGTVTDNLTGLIWLKNANCFERKTWDQALESAKNLGDNHPNNVNDCGLSDGSQSGDWRLPNIKELQSLISYGERVTTENSSSKVALPSEHPFTSVQSHRYWSSSTKSDRPTRAWNVYLSNGIVFRNGKTGVNYVWPVRGGQ